MTGRRLSLFPTLFPTLFLMQFLMLVPALAAGTPAPAVPAVPAAGARSAAPCSSSVPYRSGTSGYHTFRIPAALRLPHGTLLAFAEGRRHSEADEGDIDLVLRRSFDGGCSWQPLQLVADAGRDTVGNPVPFLDPRSGDIVLLTCRTIGGATKAQVMSGEADPFVRRVFVQRSRDGGRTWSAQRDITASVKPAGWRWYAVGPGHGLTLRHGRHFGRLLAPANHSAGKRGRSGGHSLYSDDGGHTWRIGYVSRLDDGPLALNETTAAELPDGTVYFNARDHDRGSEGTRADAYSADGGASLSVPFRPQPQLRGPVVQGSVLQAPLAPLAPWSGRADGADGADGSRLLYSGPSDPEARQRMQLRVSGDGGHTWRPLRTVSEGPAGYSDLVPAQQGLGSVGLLYESGTRTFHDSIRYSRLSVAS